jgi:hypothetical protein
VHPKIAADAATPLLTLVQAAEWLVARRVGVSFAAVGLPPVAARGPKGEPLFAVADLDAWAASLPRRGRAANARAQPRGQDIEVKVVRNFRLAGALLFDAPPPEWPPGDSQIAQDGLRPMSR